jgi:hypothetical protein
MKTTFTQEEDTLIWNTVTSRTGSLMRAVDGLIEGRAPGALINRFYYLKNQLELSETPKEEVIPLAPSTLDGIIELVNKVREEVKNLENQNELLAIELASAKADISTATNKINYQRGRILELEEEQLAFLRLMDKARAIGREEIDGKAGTDAGTSGASVS